MTLRLAAVVPAAGLSRRMRREKVLLPLESSTVLETVVGKLAEAGVAETVVVLRPDLVPAAQNVRRWNATIVVNDAPEEEMLASVRLGIRALSAEIEAFFLWPVDHPAVTTSTLSALISASGRGHAVIPRHRGRRGHPVLVGADLRVAIDRLPAGRGLRSLWWAHPDLVREVDVNDEGILLDLDTPEDYRRALGRGRIRE